MAAVMMSNAPHRKPVPGRASQTPSFTLQAPRQPPAQYGQDRLHSRSRTNSSAVMPFSNNSPPQQSISPAYSMTSQHPPPVRQRSYHDHTRRTLSNATSSTSSTTNLSRVPTNSGQSTTSGVRRSTSSRSGSSISPTSYVALMRKQKATVWCDRAQHEDPRILAAQRQAKMRAAAEVAGGHSYAAQARISTSSSGMVGGVRSKIRHHGAPKASAYNSASLGGAGVPMRLSASEVDEGNDSDEETGARYHIRNGNGSSRSSLASGGRYLNSGTHHVNGNGISSTGVSPVDSMDDVQEEETPYAGPGGGDYSAQKGGSGGSGSSGEQEESFGQVGGLPQTRGPTAEEKAAKNRAEDLRRRGSVDERTMTMSGPRLFVANPDLND